jgi:hypothetical protein
MSKSRFFRFLSDSLMVIGPAPRKQLVFGVTLLIMLPCRASAQSPVFVTQAPTSGNSGDTFFVFLPVANIGSGDAANMQLTLVTLSHLGAPATTTLQPATLPFVTGSGFLGATGVRTLDLEFDNTKLIAGNTYLLTLRGTYQAGGATLGFALNRPVKYAPGFPATHEQILDVIALKFDSRPGIDRLADNQQLLEFLTGFPQISAAGLSDPPSTVWATFADDGERLIILNNFVLPPVLPSQSVSKTTALRPSVASNSAAASLVTSRHPDTATIPPSGPSPDLPMSIKARLLNALGPDFANPVPDLHAWLVDNQGYSDPIGGGATVEALRTVGGDGVLYFNSHAGIDTKKNVPFNIWTASPTTEYKSLNVSDPIQSALKDDIDQGGIIDVIADDHKALLTGEWVSVHHYGITAEFVNNHWVNFGQNALVFINTCDSDFPDTSAQDFKDAVFAKLASVYVGWTEEVSDDFAASAARLVFDRLLGADQYCPEDGLTCHPGPAAGGNATPPVFAQRAFDYKQVEKDLPKHDLAADGAAQITFTANPFIPTSFGILAPSISNLTVDETKGQGQLTIEGIFGQNPNSGQSNGGVVTVGGPNSPVHIVSWTPEKIIVDLTSSGPGSSGDVQVVVRQHKSNVARLTEWQGTFQGVWAGNDSLKQTINFQPAFRLDLRQYRPVIHNPPVEPESVVFLPISSPVSMGSFACTGEGIYTIPGEMHTFTWMGSGNLPLLPAGSSSPPAVFFEAGGLLMNHTTMSFQAEAGGTTVGPCSFHEHIKILPPNCDPSVQSCEGDTSGQFPLLCTGVPTTNLTLDPNTAAIEGNSLPLGNLPCFVDQPGPSRVSWSVIPPLANTAPDPVSAR